MLSFGITSSLYTMEIYKTLVKFNNSDNISVKTVANPGSPPDPSTSHTWNGPGTEPGIRYKKHKIQKNNKIKAKKK